MFALPCKFFARCNMSLETELTSPLYVDALVTLLACFDNLLTSPMLLSSAFAPAIDAPASGP